MSALSRHSTEPLLTQDWVADVVQMMDEHHLVAWSDRAERRAQFAVSLGQFLSRQRDTEVCVFYGRYITDLDSFCYQLERSIPGPALERRIAGPAGVADLLRQRASFRGKPESKHRYYIWHDADVMLKANHALFGRIVDAMAGVAAEAEYVSDDLLLLHRSVFVGGTILDVYGEDPRGQFQSWASDGLGEPFWKVVTGIEAPAVHRLRIDDLCQ
jgi:hypothetical protein